MVISKERVDAICARLLKHGTQGISISGGDPLAHPELIQILEQVADKGFFFVHLLTNLYSSDKLIDDLIRVIMERRIHVTTSFDGFGEVADKIRGARNVSERVTEAVLKLHEQNMRARRKVQTRVTVVISQMNLHQIEDILNFFEKLKWEISIDIYRYSSIQHLDSDEMHIRDLDGLDKVIERCRASKNVVTPDFLLKGYTDYLRGEYPKKCPYLRSPFLGSKFFIQPNGDVLVCMGNSIGNILEQTPAEIIHSDTWKKKMKEFEACKGCWNPCYTTFYGLAPLSEMATGLLRVGKTRK